MSKTLFEKYGGFATFRKVVSAFYDKVLDSPDLQKYFANVDMPRLIDHQTRFVTYVAGGPGQVSDEQLALAHRKLGISTAEFNEAVELFIETLEDFDVEDEDIGTLAGELRKRSHLIVTK